MVLVNSNGSSLACKFPVLHISVMKSTASAAPDLVADRLKAVRKYHGLTQTEFAEAAGFQRSAYQMVESKKQPLSREMLIGLCVRYGLTADFLLFGEVHTLPFQIAQALSSVDNDAASKSSADPA